ncbi:PAN2-PAN3 deadenylation complex subunit Pan3-like [Oppia nitens]|uniref:PAN2-PAN3 deadenylation complex subunit Pan3-like n=1 Tax=Oppia nitens TaxID=1686743 RepID=UPI0023DBE018|nr:PAN2-PAN3 deadenylation complex subunit Pan3-like [Oppia nitens]
MSGLSIDPQKSLMGPKPSSSANTHAIASHLLNTSNAPIGGQQLPNYFMTDAIRQELLRKLIVSQDMASNEMYLELPQVVDVYTDLVPLEANISSPSTTFNNMICSVFRATNSKTGQLFCLRRLHSFQPNSANAKQMIAAIDSWKKLLHSNVVQLRQVFTTKAFGDNSLIFVYDYHSMANTMMSHYFHSSSTSSSSSSMNGYSGSSRPYSQQQSQRKLLPEPLIWNFIIQISSALRAIHLAGLSCRALDPTKIIITSGTSSTGSANSQEYPRLRLNGCAVFDVLGNDSYLNTTNPKLITQHFQQEDLLSFGKLCLCLSTNSIASAANRDTWPSMLELISRSYSADLRSLVYYLLSYNSNSGTTHTINDIMPMIGARFYTQLDTLYHKEDSLMDDLSKELDNGRVVRLLIKLGTINERPELQMDPNWSETGDRYLLKLFRDYLFHQFSEDGRPWLDLGHMISNLNKLDVGSPEKICLISRDEQNILIVSFAELKRCFESSLNELML